MGKVDVRKVLIVAQQVAEQQRVDAMEAGKDRLAASKQAQVESLRAATLAFAELIEAAQEVAQYNLSNYGGPRLRAVLASLAGAP